MHSAGKDELRVILEPDARVLSDLRLLIKTEKYIRRKQGTSISATVDQILRAKGAQNTDREKELIERVRSSVGKATLVINAADITSTSQDAVTRVTDGFQDLISRTYTQLKLLGGVTYSEQQVASAANPDSRPVRRRHRVEALRACGRGAVLRHPQGDTLGEQVTVKTIVDSFQTKPYGWDLPSIEVLIAFLVGSSKVTLTVDGNVLKRSEVAADAPQHPEATAHRGCSSEDLRRPQGRRVPQVLHRLLRRGQHTQGPAGTRPAWRGQAQGQARRTQGHRRRVQVPLRSAALYTHRRCSNQVAGKPDDWYLTDFDLGDDLLDAKESLIDPIQAFLNGPQRSIYDDAAAFLTTHSSNLSYLQADSDEAVRNALVDPNAFRGNRMAQLKQATDKLRTQIDAKVALNRTDVTTAIEGRKAELVASADYAKATTAAQESVLREIDQEILRVGSQNQIALIRELRASFEQSIYPGLLDQLGASQESGDDDTPPPKPKQTVSVKTVSVAGVTGVLESEEDIDRYLAALRNALIQTLNDGKRISL